MPHGFTTITPTTMEVVAEFHAGQIFPVRAGDGGIRLIEVYRADMPWSRQPPPGFDWTSDADMADILRRAVNEVPRRFTPAEASNGDGSSIADVRGAIRRTGPGPGEPGR